jgi:hypothetical protein
VGEHARPPGQDSLAPQRNAASPEHLAHKRTSHQPGDDCRLGAAPNWTTTDAWRAQAATTETSPITVTYRSARTSSLRCARAWAEPLSGSSAQRDGPCKRPPRDNDTEQVCTSRRVAACRPQLRRSRVSE